MSETLKLRQVIHDFIMEKGCRPTKCVLTREMLMNLKNDGEIFPYLKEGMPIGVIWRWSDIDFYEGAKFELT